MVNATIEKEYSINLENSDDIKLIISIFTDIIIEKYEEVNGEKDTE